MNKLTVTGKGTQIWKVAKVCLGNPDAIVAKMKAANVSHVALKINNGWYAYLKGTPEYPGYVIQALKKAGFKVGGWGYIYLKYNWDREADATIRAIEAFEPDYYLHDVESHADNCFDQANKFAFKTRAAFPKLPMGFQSCWKPSVHPERPIAEFRQYMDFDAPMIYWRGYNPIGKLLTSMLQYSQMPTKLPFAMPTGEMYSEDGITTTSAQLLEFLKYANSKVQSVMTWAADENETTPGLWKTFSSYHWDNGAKLGPVVKDALGNAQQLYESNPNRYLELYQKLKAGAPYNSSGPLDQVLIDALSYIISKE